MNYVEKKALDNPRNGHIVILASNFNLKKLHDKFLLF